MLDMTFLFFLQLMYSRHFMYNPEMRFYGCAVRFNGPLLYNVYIVCSNISNTIIS